MAAQIIRVLLADDHRMFRGGVRAALESVPNIAVVGEASNGQEAAEMAVQLKPDVVLMDVQMPVLNGVEATRRIAATNPSVGIIVVTMFEDTDLVISAMRAGARGYILKDAGEDELIRSVIAVANGEALFGPAIALRLIQYLAVSGVPAAKATAFKELSDREQEVLEMLAQGLNNQKVAERMDLSLKTVRNYVSNILSKLHAIDREEAIARARAAGLGR